MKYFLARFVVSPTPPAGACVKPDVYNSLQYDASSVAAILVIAHTSGAEPSCAPKEKRSHAYENHSIRFRYRRARLLSASFIVNSMISYARG